MEERQRGIENLPISAYLAGMLSRHHPEPTGWDSLPGDPWDQPYGLPFFRGEKVSVSSGRLAPSYWYEHTHDLVRLIFTFNHAQGLIETTRGDSCRIPTAFLDPHHVFIISPGLETTLHWQNRAEVVILYIEPNAFGVREDFQPSLIGRDFRPLARNDPYLAQLAQMFLGLHRLADRPEPEFVEGIGMALASRTLQQCFSRSEPGPKSRSGLPPATVDQVTSYVDDHLSDVIPVRDLARKFGLSPDHFARRLKISVKMSPKQFMLRRRMEKVRELLSSGNYNVTQAGQEVGFDDPSHLNRCFRNVYGYSPMAVLKAALLAPGDN